MTTGPEYDVQAIRRLDGFESDGRTLAAALYDELRVGGRAEVDALGQAVAASQYERVKHLAHSLKSSGRSLGLMAFGAACERMEHADPAAADLPALFADLDQRFEAGCRWLVQVLAADQVEGS